MSDLTLVAHFNAFTGQLQGGYLMARSTKRKIGATMTPRAVLDYMLAHPNARVEPIKA
ncbi:MAG TPA: hypothetical protein VGN74_05540 [Brevundimonas sp.]|jgi:hypothetical protein|uniref:hypothetical protein n=1 Tax=Brevundimonas sp. TaxID=1871086 RepID=UPI002E1439B1|nr:hypothetical protein [Brevundimonas sp.]